MKLIAGRCKEAAGNTMCHGGGTCLPVALPGPAAVTTAAEQRGLDMLKLKKNNLKNRKNFL